MKFFTLGETLDTNQVGNKAAFLSHMKEKGFNVPDGIVLSCAVFNETLLECGVSHEIKALLSGLNEKKFSEISVKIGKLTEGLTLSEEIIEIISMNTNSGKKYAVRSSGIKEDLGGYSFAGQYNTFINVSGTEDISKAVVGCFRSVFSDTVLSYLASNAISADELGMAVIIEEMVNSEISGIAFTINPVTGNDKEIVIEATSGQGENLVSGKVKAKRYCFDWYNEKITSFDDDLLDEAEVKTIAQKSLEIQMLFGYPCDIEFAFEDGTLYILQARAITKVMYGQIKDQWTTADFKDGGVSASVCTPYMWSLYEYIWESEFRSFLVESKILKDSQMQKLGDMFYGRPYWNLSVGKAAMSRVPGYKEREFDSELGVKITYDGDGVTTGVTLKSIVGIIIMAVAQKKIVSERNKNAQSLKDGLLEKYQMYYDKKDSSYKQDEICSIWKTLVFEDYLKSESIYFRQIFINTIHQSLYKGKILKHTTSGGYFHLIGGLNNISHLLPFYDMWEISRSIQNDPLAFKFWSESSTEEIQEMLSNKSSDYYIDKLREHIEKFGYHSQKELDVTFPCYCEDTKTVINDLKEAAKLDNSCAPSADREKLRQSFEGELDAIKKKTRKGKFNKIKKSIKDMRRMLWWREEFRDISTRFYYIIRVYTIHLSKQLVLDGFLKQQEDIWFLKIRDVRDVIEQKITKSQAEQIIERNKKYYNSFRNYTSENEIGHVFDGKVFNRKKDGLHGIGCNNGCVTGTARVIADIEQIDRLQVGDILVTKFTDTGWTSKFAILNGIVTEYGGILCHAAIVSREYGIPCVVCAENATKLIHDGATITINGETGAIQIIEDC